MVFETAHKLMRRVAIWAQKVGAIRTARHGALFGLAGGTQYCHIFNSGHVQYIGENIVARERRGTLRTNGSLLMAYRTDNDGANFGIPSLVHEELIQTRFAEYMETGEHPGRAQLAHAQGATLIASFTVARCHLLQGIAGIAAVGGITADGVDITFAEYIAAVDLLGASGDAAARRGSYRGRSGRDGHRGRCHPAIPSVSEL